MGHARFLLLALAALGAAGADPACAAEAASDYVVTTVAGTGTAGFGGDGGPATEALLNEPSGVAVGPGGDLYIADNDNNRIRRVTPDGVITTIAGTGDADYSGDGGPASEAKLNNPYGVWVDASGNLYIADSRNHRVRRIGPNGIIRTVAGNGIESFAGDGGPAREAALSHPDDMVLDGAGNLYIADAGNDRIRRVAPDGTITTFAGTGRHRYNGESGFDGDGGPAVDARLDTPAALAVDRSGKLYIADLRNHAVRAVAANGTISTVAGTGVAGFNGDRSKATRARLREPGGLDVGPDGSLFVADGQNWRVRRLAPGGGLRTIAGAGTEGYSGDGGPARLAQFSTLDFVAVAPSGVVYVADYGNHAIRKLTPSAAATDGGDPVQWLLLRMRDAYARIDRALIGFSEERPGKPPTTGTVEYVAPDRICARFEVPDYGTVRVSADGFRITTLDPTEARPDLRVRNERNLNRMLLGNLEIYSLYDWQRQLSTANDGNMRYSTLKRFDAEHWADRRWTVLEEDAGRIIVRYWIDPQRHLIHRTVQSDAKSGATLYESRVLSMELNPAGAVQRTTERCLSGPNP